ncbi:hypothetical protein B296_00055572 [Ensete ventricosum]|uniref:Uncharacterized protein n=1 Tax=Ensete ventricosum TaxID=4639 RepID=A0A426XJ15_ENSVE|nr:hypothetical protein B296_00055572 [Ensete ventricosum]
MPWVGHRPNLGFVYGLLSLVSRAGQVILDRPKWILVNKVYPEPTCTVAPAEVPVEGVGKHSDEGGSEPSRKKTKVTVSKCLKKAALGEGSERAHRSKGKELMKEATESPNHPPTVRELCEVDGWAGKDRYFGLYFAGALVDRAHDAGRVVRLLIERNSMLRVENKELKLGTGPKDVAATEKRATELSTEVERLKAALGESGQHYKDHELAVDSAYSELKDHRELHRQLKDKVLTLTQDAKVLQFELKMGRGKAIANYKGSRGFQFGLEKMGQVTYEFGYRVAPRTLLRKIPDLICREGPLICGWRRASL